MSLPTGKYRAVLLWIAQRRNKTGYNAEFILVDTGERETAFIRKQDAGLIGGQSGFILKDGCWQRPEAGVAQPVVKMHIEYQPKFQSSRILFTSRTGETIDVDAKYNLQTFQPEEF